MFIKNPNTNIYFFQNLLPTTLINHPAGNSVNELKHLTQGSCNNNFDFKHFNYGPKGNLKKYKQLEPPPYNIKDIPNKIVVFYGTEDLITVPRDVKRLIEDVKHLNPKVYRLEGYNHFDFILGKNLQSTVNLKIVNTLRI